MKNSAKSRMVVYRNSLGSQRGTGRDREEDENSSVNVLNCRVPADGGDDRR